MIKRRLYFLLPDIEHTEMVVQDLITTGISKKQMYAIAGQGVDPDGLPVDPMELSPDKDARIESIFWIGNLVLFVIAFASLIILLMSPMDGYWWLLPALIMMLTFVGGLEFATRIPNEHLAEFHDAMRHYEILLMIDVPLRQVSRVENLVHKKHPEAVVSGVGWRSGTLQV